MNNKVNILEGIREGRERAMDTIIKVLEGLKDKASARYWINAMVNQKELSQGQAGYLVIKFNL